MANQSDAFSVSDDDVISSDDSFSVSFPVTPPPPTLMEAIFGDLGGDDGGADRVPEDVAGDDGSKSKREPEPERRMMVILCGGIKYGDYVNRERDEDQCDDDDEDYCDLDDELIPWSVSKKVKRDRMRKFGKKSLYSQLKPGCVYGKHGLGIRFRC